MAKSKLSDNRSFKGEGILNIESTTGKIMLDVEDVGSKSLAELLHKYDGELVKISVSFSNAIE